MKRVSLILEIKGEDALAEIQILTPLINEPIQTLGDKLVSLPV
jgi:hypothetical protein